MFRKKYNKRVKLGFDTICSLTHLSKSKFVITSNIINLMRKIFLNIYHYFLISTCKQNRIMKSFQFIKEVNGEGFLRFGI